MFVVNTRSAENGRRLCRIRELMGRVISHGVVPENPRVLDFSMQHMLSEKNAYVMARGGTVRQPITPTGALEASMGDTGTDDDNEE